MSNSNSNLYILYLIFHQLISPTVPATDKVYLAYSIAIYNNPIPVVLPIICLSIIFCSEYHSARKYILHHNPTYRAANPMKHGPYIEVSCYLTWVRVVIYIQLSTISGPKVLATIIIISIFEVKSKIVVLCKAWRDLIDL